MSLKLYGLGPSRSFRCLWALCETSLAFDYIPVSFDADGENSAKSKDYLSKNIQGKVPTLQHADFVVTESLAIVNYIDSLTDQEFIPTTPKPRATYDQLTSFIVTELEQPLWTTGKHRFALPEEHRVAQIFPTAEFEFAKAVDALDQLVSVKNYALGDSFSYADIMLAQTINWADRFKFQMPAEYFEYRDRMYQRDAVQKATKIIS
ncbi:MAG: glutathione S-transferase family protein [Acidiferrobacterales bacterium]|nr:glutathione S-transferase family protein [Acidiferrobacterales bacterium]